MLRKLLQGVDGSLGEEGPLLRAGGELELVTSREPGAIVCLSELGSVNAVIKISTGSYAWDRK